jgi:hypothetical protein
MTTSAKRMALSVSAIESFSSFSSIRGIRASDYGDADRLLGRFFGRGLLIDLGGRVRKRRAKRIVKICQSLSMLRADRHRIAQSERIGFERTGFAGTAFAFVGDQNSRLAGFAYQIGEGLIGRSRAGARIDQKQDRVRLRHCGCGLRLHLSRQALGRRVLEAGRIDHPKRQIAEPALAFPAITRDARLIVDKRAPRPDQTIEERGFADIGPADNGEREGHGSL